MSGVPMVHLRTVHSAFHAQVIAARLGADGIVTQLRGNVCGPYPVGDVSVWVAPEDVETAKELLMADEVESAFDLPEAGEPWDEQRRRPLLLGLTATQLMAVLGIMLMLSGLVARVII